VIDAPTYNRLQGIIRREGRSLLQYADDSFPWAAGAGEAADVAEVKRLAAAEREAYAALGRLLVKHRLTPPWLGAFPVGFTSFNYLSVTRLLPLLARYQRDGIAALEADLRHFSDDEVRFALKHVLEVKNETLANLEALGAPPQQAPNEPAPEPAAL
jgi:hypothetical protein